MGRNTKLSKLSSIYTTPKFNNVFRFLGFFAGGLILCFANIDMSGTSLSLLEFSQRTLYNEHCFGTQLMTINCTIHTWACLLFVKDVRKVIKCLV